MTRTITYSELTCLKCVPEYKIYGIHESSVLSKISVYQQSNQHDDMSFICVSTFILSA